MINKVSAFYDQYNEVMNDIQSVINEEKAFGAVGLDIETIKAQHREFKEFSIRVHEVVGNKVDKTYRGSEILFQSIALGVNTSIIEKDLDKMYDLWNSLKGAIAEREQRLDQAILNSGKVLTFYDQYNVVINDIQTVIKEEKAFGVVGGDIETIKAHQNEFKEFCRRVVEAVGKEVDKTNQDGQKLIQNAAPGVNTSIMAKDLEKMNDLWNSLKDAIADRKHTLHQALLNSGILQEGMNSFFDELDEMFEKQKPSSSDHKVINPWLYGAEKKVNDMEVVPTQVNHIQRKIKELNKLHQEILAKQPSFDAQGFTEKIEELTNRYDTLVFDSNVITQFLHYCMGGHRNFALVYEELLLWIETIDKKLVKSKSFYVFQEKLLGQMEELHSITKGIVIKTCPASSTPKH